MSFLARAFENSWLSQTRIDSPNTLTLVHKRHRTRTLARGHRSFESHEPPTRILPQVLEDPEMITRSQSARITQLQQFLIFVGA